LYLNICFQKKNSSELEIEEEEELKLEKNGFEKDEKRRETKVVF
jgi:hypothetical protein